MTTQLAEWAFEHRQITKNRRSDACGREAVLFAVERWYDFHKLGGLSGKGRLNIIGHCFVPLCRR